MREHLPSLVMRASALVHHVGHFYHGALRVLEVGLLRLQGSPRILGRRTTGQSSPAPPSDKNPRDLASKRKREIPTKRTSSTRVTTSGHFSSSDGTKESSENKKLIISIHIPKTGGTAFLQVLKASVPDILYLDWGRGGSNPVFRHGKRVAVQLQSIADLELGEGLSVIHGHFEMGKYLSKFPEAIYVTWLRDPVERLISHYFFWQRRPFMDNPLCNRLITEQMSLEDFALLARNVQHRFLSPAGVERFAFVGITEEYERSLELFHRLICPEINVIPTMQNSNPNRPGNFYDVGAGLREKILKLNELDAYTYLNGLRRFRRLCEKVGI
jgi:hypothetical protein